MHWFQRSVNLIKRWLSGRGSDDLSMSRMAYLNGIDRRKNARVRYPLLRAVGQLPWARVGPELVPVHDISAGGLCLFDKKERLGHRVGIKLKVSLLWPDLQLEVPCRVVSAYRNKRHIQFLKVSKQVEERISAHVAAASTGRRLKKCTNPLECPVLLSADELWLGPGGESLTFLGTTVHAHIFQRSLLLQRDGQVIDGKTESAADNDVRIQLLIALANIESPTPAIEEWMRRVLIHVQDERWEGEKALG